MKMSNNMGVIASQRVGANQKYREKSLSPPRDPDNSTLPPNPTENLSKELL
jgi:hypothetical protein